MYSDVVKSFVLSEVELSVSVVEGISVDVTTDDDSEVENSVVVKTSSVVDV